VAFLRVGRIGRNVVDGVAGVHDPVGDGNAHCLYARGPEHRLSALLGTTNRKSSPSTNLACVRCDQRPQPRGQPGIPAVPPRQRLVEHQGRIATVSAIGDQSQPNRTPAPPWNTDSTRCIGSEGYFAIHPNPAIRTTRLLLPGRFLQPTNRRRLRYVGRASIGSGPG
jgi:hypothetical protein